ncbi:MAG TPA: N-6 DNA methylase [Verrucomicrobiae bacterium]|jgi:type I restriction-modification system DNA methylase subunit|nr:N-6 DNA methylase [Verrucomicrobiae bacterium]
MSIVFENERHERIYRVVVKCLRGLGFTGELVQQRYAFNDWFLPGVPQREVCAAFGQTPLSYDSACFAVLPYATPATPTSIANYRALGAPFALEVREDGVIPWRVGRDAGSTSQFAGRIPLDAIEAAFDQRKFQWSPESILRAKNIGLPSVPSQLDFIDLGLIPALEEEIADKLHQLLNEALAAAQKVYKQRTGQSPDVRQLFRLIFQLLAGRVLSDRAIPGFRNLSAIQDPSTILEQVRKHYGENLPILQDKAAQQAAFEQLWTGFSFQNLSVDILAHIYENTLVDPHIREELGIQSTPRSIARYIVNRLPFENIPCDQRLIVEPCSGHGVFLVSALKRLRDLLPASMDGQERHRYFVRMLCGFEKDEFALEVSRLCLTLADFPNHNGWKVKPADVFTSEEYERTLRQARVVLCNPPFQDFKKAAKQRKLGMVKKPIAVLEKVLSNLAPDGLLGFVLPRQFVSGRGYRNIREQLARRYDEVEIVALPDRVFHGVDLETCLILGKRPQANHHRISIHFTEVRDDDRSRFLTHYESSRQDIGHKTEIEVSENLSIPALSEVWERLRGVSRLQDISEIHRGVEWKQPFRPDKYLSRKTQPDFVAGVNSAQGEFRAFEQPESIFLCARSEFQRGGAWSLPWSAVKVVVNAVRISRDPWCLAAFVDTEKLTFSQNFHALWPKRSYPPYSLAAILNNPLVSAFVAVHEGKMHVKRSTLCRVPIPELSPDQHATLETLVIAYQKAIGSGSEKHLELWMSRSAGVSPRDLILQIDALILQAYNLPPRLERKLLDFFQDAKSPRAVPFQFGEYFPSNFTPTIPLWRFVSPDFSQCSGRRLLEIMPKVTDSALVRALEEEE